MAKSTMQRTATPVVMMIMIDYGFSNDEVGAIIVLGGGRHIFSASANQRGRCKDKKTSVTLHLKWPKRISKQRNFLYNISDYLSRIGQHKRAHITIPL